MVCLNYDFNTKRKCQSHTEDVIAIRVILCNTDFAIPIMGQHWSMLDLTKGGSLVAGESSLSGFYLVHEDYLART